MVLLQSKRCVIMQADASQRMMVTNGYETQITTPGAEAKDVVAVAEDRTVSVVAKDEVVVRLIGIAHLLHLRLMHAHLALHARLIG